MIRFPVKTLIAAAILAAAFGFGCTTPPSEPSASPPTESGASSTVSQTSARPIATTPFIDEMRMRAAWVESATSPDRVPGTIVAGVVNHHVLASDLLADFFRRLKLSHPNITRVVILSPDHYHVGRATISTHVRSYQTPDGEVTIDVTSTRQLIEEGFATEESAMFEREHGIGALVSFLRHEFSDVRIIPLAVRGQIPRSEAIAIGKRLAKLADEQTIVIVSADMSHYLSETEAQRNDVETKKALEALDSSWFGNVDDDFTDNGASFVILRSFLDARHIAPTFTLFDHSISTRYGGPADNTTSYVTGVWSR